MTYINESPPVDNRPRPAEGDATEIIEDEDTIYAKAFQKCLTNLANEVYGNADPYDIAQRVLRAACEFYDADWCGMFDADMMLDLWMPFWWYNRITGGMTQTQLQEGQVVGSYEMFRKMIMGNADCYIPDIEIIRFTRPEEYALFKGQDVKAFLAVPYSRRDNGIIFLRNPKKFGNRPNMLRIISNIVVQEINEQKHLDLMKINAATSEVRKDADVVVKLFGGIEIMTEQGKLVEAEMKSAVCSKLFVLLMLNRNKAMQSKSLGGMIWGDKECESPNNNVRAALYRLRQMFELISDKQLIVTGKKGYRINPEIVIHTDYERFEELSKKAASFMSKDKQIEVLKEAVDVYTGKLFPNGDGDMELMSAATYYHMMYLDTVVKLMRLLNEVEDYMTMQDYSMKATKIEPNNTSIIYWLVVAMRKNGAIEMAKKHLESAKARLLEEEYRELERMLGIVA